MDRELVRQEPNCETGRGLTPVVFMNREEKK